MFHKILVPLDRSQLAEYALQPAAQLAAAANGQVILLHAVNTEPIETPEVMGYSLQHPSLSLPQDRHREAGQAYLDGVETRMRRLRGDVYWQSLLLDGEAASTIVDVAADEGVDLIVMSTHGYSGLTRWLLGSVTEKVLRVAPCPILVVRDERPIAKIVITLDGSSLSEMALAPGFAVARAFGAEVWLLMVEADVDFIGQEDVAALDQVKPGLGDLYAESYYQRAEAYLEEIALRHREAGYTVQTAVFQGAAATQILDFAEHHQIDLLVMATHGRSGLRRWAYGSVTEKVLRKAEAAMLIIRPPKSALK